MEKMKSFASQVPDDEEFYQEGKGKIMLKLNIYIGRKTIINVLRNGLRNKFRFILCSCCNKFEIFWMCETNN